MQAGALGWSPLLPLDVGHFDLVSDWTILLLFLRFSKCEAGQAAQGPYLLKIQSSINL